MVEKTKPIKCKYIGVYECPSCEYLLLGTREAAKKHIEVPIGEGVILPRGFVFGRWSRMHIEHRVVTRSYLPGVYRSIKYFDDEIVIPNYSKRILPVTETSFGSRSHVLQYEVCRFYDFKYAGIFSSIDSAELANGYDKREFLLTEEQFDEFKDKLGRISNAGCEFPLKKEELVRTVPGIEKLLEPST